MSVSTQLETLKAKVNEYFSKVLTALNEKPAVVSHSVGSTKLGGNTPAELSSQAAALSATHRANTNNPHTLTPTQVNAYTQAEVGDMASDYIPQGILALSRFGTLDYLPAGVSGSFEGATTQRTTATDGINRREQYSMQLEDNGTLSILRNGTDGSSQGVYYGYIPNAANTFTGGKITFTSRRYSPPFLPANNTVAYLYQGGQDALAGRLQDASGALGNVFIALTKGTLNDVAHTAVFLDPAWDTMIDRCEIIVSSDMVYMLYNQYATPGAPSDGAPLDFRMFQIPLSSFGSASIVTPTEMTFGQCIGFMGAIYNTGKIRLAALAESSSAATPALIQHINAPSTWFAGGRHIGGSGRVMTLSVFNADKSKLRVLVMQDPRYNAAGGNLQPGKVAFSFVITMADLTVALDAGMTPMQITQPDPGTPILTFTGGVIGSDNGTTIEGTTGVDISFRPYITETGIIFTSRIPYGPASLESVYRGKWNTFTSAFDAVKAPMYDHVPETREALSCPLNFGSLAGDAFDGFRLLPNNKALVTCRNTIRTNALVKFKLKEANEDLSTNYTYKSPTYPAGMIGFKPTVDRVNIDLSYRPTLLSVLEEMNDTSYTVRGSVLVNSAGYEIRYVSLNDDLSTTGTVQASQDQLNTLRDQIITAAGFNPAQVIGKAYIELIISQNPAVPVYAYVTFVTSTFDRRAILSLVTVSARNGIIASMTAGTQILSTTFGVLTNGTGLFIDESDAFRNGTHVIYEISDGFMVVGNSLGRYQYPGGSTYSRYTFFVNKSDGSIVYPRITTATASVPGGRWGGFPGRGVGNIYNIDYSAKLIFQKWATTKGEMGTWQASPEADAVVLISQEVAQGWILYFTEDTPVIINGWSGVLASTSIDLTTVDADPANTTFYVYAENTGSTFVYRVYLTYTEPAQNQLYLGTVVTGNNGIAAINISKVTEFAGKRILTTPTGGSIPASPGLPSQVGALDSGWWPN